MTTKAERSRGMPRRRPIETPAAPSRLPLLIIGGVLAVVVIVALVVAFALGSTPSSNVAEPAVRPLAVTGSTLPSFTDPANDPAIGQTLPTLSGIGMDGQPLSISPGQGPMAIVVLAHWCSFCQAEVPQLVDYVEAGRLPEGVQLVALATGIDPTRPNFPPSSWLEREAWSGPTLIDDGSSSGLAALGLSSFPGFVFVDADGQVAYRHTGALGADAFGQLVEAIAP
ncbi:MAG TPA: TlpA disulfide reductase family protein [Candidatus Angelobacter sp.]|nr:TlpA disulfide reductase family protein [Candidatus Angelobacter sp.]